MEQRPSSEVNCHSATQITRLLWYPKVHYRVHNSPATGPYPEPDGSNPRLPNSFL